MNLQIFIFLLVLVLIRLVEWDFFDTEISTGLPAVAASTEAQTNDSSLNSRHLTSLERADMKADVAPVHVASSDSVDTRNSSLLPAVQRVQGKVEAEVAESETTVRVRSSTPDIAIVPDTAAKQDAEDARSPI